MSLVLEEHRHYLADEARVSAYRRALAEVVRPGDVVLDLGAGTGILGLLACQAGAGRVYSVEEGSVIELARRLSETNGFRDRMILINGLSTEVNLPEKVDVVVADQIGFGPEFGLVDFFSDARERFLKPGGTLIPRQVDLYVAPVEYPMAGKQFDSWGQLPGGLNFGPGRPLAANSSYRVRFEAEQLLAEPTSPGSLDLATASPTPIKTEASLTANRSGALHGIAGWFRAQLSPNVVVSNSPLDPCAVRRDHVFFPIERPVALAEGDRIELRMFFLPSDSITSWNIEIFEARKPQDNGSRPTCKGTFAHSTWKGMLLCKEELQRTRPDFVPRLTSLGEARRTVFDLCDGSRSLAEIEQEVYQRHPGRFRSQKEVAGFVAEVVSRYSQV